MDVTHFKVIAAGDSFHLSQYKNMRYEPDKKMFNSFIIFLYLPMRIVLLNSKSVFEFSYKG